MTKMLQVGLFHHFFVQNMKYAHSGIVSFNFEKLESSQLTCILVHVRTTPGHYYTSQNPSTAPAAQEYEEYEG
jgi:hypothetical protein